MKVRGDLLGRDVAAADGSAGGLVQGVEPESAWASEEEEDWSHEPSVHGGRRVLLFSFPRFFGRVATVAQVTYGTCALQLRSNCRG